MKQEFVISELINFFVVAIVFLIGITIVFTIFCKKFKFNSKNVEIYGLLLNLNTTSLISMAALTINYLFLVWCTVSFEGLNVIYVTIILTLVLISEAVLDNFGELIKSIPLAIIDCAAIQLISLLYEYITKEEFSFLLLIVLFLSILFVFLYYTYNLFRGINNIVIKNKKILILNCMEYYAHAYTISRKYEDIFAIICICSNSNQKVFIEESKALHNHSENIYSFVINCISNYQKEEYAKGNTYIYGPIQYHEQDWLKKEGFELENHSCSILKLSNKPEYFYGEFTNNFSRFGRSDNYQNNPKNIEIGNLMEE